LCERLAKHLSLYRSPRNVHHVQAFKQPSPKTWHGQRISSFFIRVARCLELTNADPARAIRQLARGGAARRSDAAPLRQIVSSRHPMSQTHAEFQHRQVVFTATRGLIAGSPS